MSSFDEKYSKFLSLLAVLSRVRDSLRNKVNNGTDSEKGFLVPFLRLLDGLFDALSSRRGAVEIGEYSAQFREEVAFYSGLLAGVDCQWQNFPQLLPEEYNDFIRILSEFVRAYRFERERNFAKVTYKNSFPRSRKPRDPSC